MGVDLDEDALGGVDVDLEQPGLVEGRVEQREQALRRAIALSPALVSLPTGAGEGREHAPGV